MADSSRHWKKAPQYKRHFAKTSAQIKRTDNLEYSMKMKNY